MLKLKTLEKYDTSSIITINGASKTGTPLGKKNEK